MIFGFFYCIELVQSNNNHKDKAAGKTMRLK